jgi:hypothetical protein
MTPTLRVRRVAQIASGPYCSVSGRVVCCDSDHDSLPEMIFSTGSARSWDPFRIEVWEHQGWNRFSFAFADTGVPEEYPVGVRTGNVVTFAAGDVDGDGLTDIAGFAAELDTTGPDSVFSDVVVLESPDSHNYPRSLSWCCRYGVYNGGPVPVYFPPDLDGDGHREIMLCGGRIWENVGNDSNELVWSGTPSGGYYAFGDFRVDGKMSFATGGGSADVWENNGDDSYERIWRDTSLRGGAGDVFSSADIDGDGRPEFYLAEFNYVLAKMWLYMYEAESDGSYQFTRALVDSLTYMGAESWGRASAGGDIDGDGIDECIWTTYDSVRIYKAFGDNDLRKVWDWRNDHHDTTGFNSLTTTVYDVNGDGYNELLLAGNAKISIFEVDAVDLRSPNGGSCSVGDTVMIRWRTNTPPRCDSLSLFLRRDSLWNLDTIARGLPGTDTSYRWVVPAGVPETARVVVIAYGPGWQFDMSDSAISFASGGVAEGTRNVPQQWSLSVSPNPTRGAFTVRYDVPGKWGQSQGGDTSTERREERDADVSPARGRAVQSPFSLGIYDAGGRLVRSLCEGEVAPGRYEARIPSGALPAGIYFLRLDTPGFRSVKKAVVTR